METTDKDSGGIGCLGIVGIVVVTILVTIAVTVWAINSQLFGSRFTPVELNESEQSALASKLSAVGLGELAAPADEDFTPQPYTEDPDKREIALTERELNALVANQNPDAAERVAIDLADDLISARLRVPLDPDFPFLGGKILKASAGVSVSYSGDKPRVVLRGVSVWGVPIPNAWLGNVKNVDLVNEFGTEEGFWKQFSEGVENVEIREGELFLKLRE